MFIHEYGSRYNPTIILLAPMMVSGSDLYSFISPHLTGEYHIIAPDQGGHGQAGQYVSADQEYKELKSFLFETGCTQIHLLYGNLPHLKFERAGTLGTGAERCDFYLRKT